MATEEASETSCPDSESLTAERAFELLQDRHVVTWLESCHRRKRLQPSTNDSEVVHETDDGIVAEADDESEIGCQCGESFDTVADAKAHIDAVSQVENGLFAPADIPLRFDFESSSETLTVEPEYVPPIEVTTHPSMAFMTEEGVQRGDSTYHISGTDVNEVAQQLSFEIADPAMPRTREQKYVPETEPFEYPLLGTMFRKAVNWFERETPYQLEDLSLWCGGGKVYLIAPVEAHSVESLQGILMAGCRTSESQR